MIVQDNRYTCEYGWSISLPVDWVRLGGQVEGVLALSQPVVFAKSGEWDTSITWMVRGHQVDGAVAGAFRKAVSEEGPTDRKAVIPIIDAIFPLIGEPDQVLVVTLADGCRALESIESYFEGELKRGYQLILPLSLPSGHAETFQRLCFYAPDQIFRQHLQDVREAARSFRYDRPYGYTGSV